MKEIISVLELFKLSLMYVKSGDIVDNKDDRHLQCLQFIRPDIRLRFNLSINVNSF